MAIRTADEVSRHGGELNIAPSSSVFGPTHYGVSSTF